MTRSTTANNKIVYLLVGFLLQSYGVDSRAADTTASTATDAVKTNAAAVEDGAESLLKSAGSTAMDFGSETTKSVEEIIKAGGRASLAVGNLCNQLFNTISLTLATGTGYLANGVETVDGLLNGVPIVGVITGGANKVANGLSTTLGEISSTGRQSRTKMFNQLREQLNQSTGVAADVPTNAAATTAAAATTTNSASAASSS